jgi:hypothetical protein
MVLAERDRWNDERYAVCAKVKGLAIHAHGSAGSFQIFWGGYRNAQCQSDPMSRDLAAIADKFSQARNNGSREFSHRF